MKKNKFDPKFSKRSDKKILLYHSISNHNAEVNVRNFVKW